MCHFSLQYEHYSSIKTVSTQYSVLVPVKIILWCMIEMNCLYKYEQNIKMLKMDINEIHPYQNRVQMELKTVNHGTSIN
jgi:hypothetical protein